MDRKVIQILCLTAFALIGMMGEKGINAKISLPATPAPTAQQIERAYQDCLHHDCSGFQQWSVKAYEICSEGCEEACQEAVKLLEEIKTPRAAQPIYEKNIPHSFKGDNERTFEEDDPRFIQDFSEEKIRPHF